MLNFGHIQHDISSLQCNLHQLQNSDIAGSNTLEAQKVEAGIDKRNTIQTRLWKQKTDAHYIKEWDRKTIFLCQIN